MPVRTVSMRTLRRTLLAMLLSVSLAGLAACDDVGADSGVEGFEPSEAPTTLEDSAE